MFFKVEGTVRGKQRPRMAKGFAYTPKQTVNYEQWIKHCYLQSHKQDPHHEPVMMKIVVVIQRPKGHYNSKGEVKPQFLSIVPTKKPDMDNIVKIVADSLNGIAYHDDAQVYDLRLTKEFGEKEYLLVYLHKFSELR